MRRKSSNYQNPRISGFRDFMVQSATSHLREYIYLQIIRVFFRSIFCYFLQKIEGFSVSFRFFRSFSGFFETVCFGCFASIPKQRDSMFRLNRNKQKTHPNSLKESILGNFLENLVLFGLFRFLTKQFCLFRLFRYRFETTKQTETFCFGFHETNRNKRETDLVSVCFGSNRNLFLFVSRTPYFRLQRNENGSQQHYSGIIR